MWTCSRCRTEVKDQFENCPTCGTGRDGSKPPVDVVKKKDAIQPGLPATADTNKATHNRILAVLLVLGVILFLLYLAFL